MLSCLGESDAANLVIGPNQLARWAAEARALERGEPKGSVGAMVPLGWQIWEVERIGDDVEVTLTRSDVAWGNHTFETLYCGTGPTIEAAIQNAAERVTK